MHNHKRLAPARAAVGVEPLEHRVLLAATPFVRIPSTDIRYAGSRPASVASTQYQVLTYASPAAGAAAPTSAGKNPAQIRRAYGVDSILFGSVVGDGTGQTIAIVDAYDDPSFVSTSDPNYAISDLHRFSVQFGLPDPPSFTKVSQTGSTTSLPAYDAGWAGEIALDVEWVHSMAPVASIVLVEANSASLSDLAIAVNYAKSLPGVSAVSMSFGTDEFPTESSFDSTYTTPAGHAGVTFLASTGDDGSPGGYPAYSPNVVAVGGTSLYLADAAGTYSSEAGWSGSGGGISSRESKPSYQSSVTQSSKRRTTPDVSAVADPYTGVWVLDSSETGIGSANGWYIYGGTSLSAPLWAGLVGVVNQGRALAGLSPLDGRSQTLPRLYSLVAADFHDVTTGSNGSYSAAAGYDLVTGRGTPIANKLVPDLAGGITISGAVFRDTNGNGARDPGETGMSGVAVWIDADNDGVRDSNETSATTDSSGAYAFPDLLGGLTYVIRKTASSGYVPSSPASATLVPTYGQSVTLNFGNYPSFTTAYTGAAFTLRLDPAGTTLEIYTASSATGTPTYAFPRNVVTTLTFTGTSAADVFAVDLANGNPVASVTITYNGGTGSDAVLVRGSDTADTVTFSATAINANSGTLTLSSVESFSFDGRLGSDAVTVNTALPLTLPAEQELASLTLAAGAKAILSSGRNTIYTRALSLAATSTLDLTDGTLILDDSSSGGVASATALLRSAYNNGSWTGPGITSSAAANDPARVTALGYLTATDLGLATYDGFPVSPAALLVRYTYYGDATLDGRITADDFALTDRGYAKHLTGWLNGDFNYDGSVDASDYALLNRAYSAIAAPAATEIVVTSDTTSTSVAPLLSTAAAPRRRGKHVFSKQRISHKHRWHQAMSRRSVSSSQLPAGS